MLNPIVRKFQYGQHTVTLETGMMARQATAAVMVSMDDTAVFGVNLWVNGNHGRDNLHFVYEAFREQRTNRAVNQTRDQGFAFAWTAFTTDLPTDR